MTAPADNAEPQATEALGEATFDASQAFSKAGNVDLDLAEREASLWTPLAATGQPLSLDALSALPSGRSARVGLSKNLRRLLVEAAAVTMRRDADGFAFVDPAAIWRALFSAALSTENWAPQTNILHFLLEHFRSRHLTFVNDLQNGISTSRQEAAPEQGALTSEALDLLSSAEQLVQRVAEDDSRFVTARHLVFALLADRSLAGDLVTDGLLPPEATASESSFEGFWRELVDALGSHVLGQLHKEKAEAWQPLVERLAGAPPGLPDNARVVADYLADARVPLPTASSDPLGAVRDAAALSELICLEAASPPLAIGLFGNWGSGKTTFMQLMQREIDEIAGEAASRRLAGENLPFVEHVVHVWFNAWTYADKGNLWASIATELFRQLSVGGWQGRDRAIQTKYLDQVRRAVDMETADLNSRRQAVADADRRLADKQREADELEAALDRAAQQGLMEHGARILGQLVLTDPERVTAALREMGREVPEGATARPADVVAALSEMQGLTGRIRTFWNGLWRGERRWTHRAHLALMLAGSGVVGFGAVELGQETLGWAGAALATFAGWLEKGRRLTGHLDRVLSDADSDMRRQEVVALEARRTQLRQDAEQLRLDLETSRALLRKAEAAARTLDKLIDGGEERLLAYFIRERWEQGGWRKHLGVVAMVQEAIEELSVLLRNESARFDAARAANPATAGEAPIQRIVLYIDDLDRCHPDQVAEVLQAVHLLLAYPVFVVVVGVDPDWLSRSLIKVYPEQLRGFEGRENGGPHATVADYLEKIFQIPYWLRPLAEADDLRYQRLVNAMLGRPLDEFDARTRRPGSATGGEEETGAETGPLDLRRFLVDDRVAPQAALAERATGEIWQSVALTDAEVRLMRRLGPLAGKSPRAVKRFVNLYRLIRAREQAEPGFLEGEPPLWPAAMFLLALEIGQPPERLEEFHDEWAKLDGNDPIIGDAFHWAEWEKREKFGVEGKFHKGAFWSDILIPALYAVREADENLKNGALRPNGPAARAVGRFSMGRLVG